MWHAPRQPRDPAGVWSGFSAGVAAPRCARLPPGPALPVAGEAGAQGLLKGGGSAVVGAIAADRLHRALVPFRRWRSVFARWTNITAAAVLPLALDRPPSTPSSSAPTHMTLEGVGYSF